MRSDLVLSLFTIASAASCKYGSCSADDGEEVALIQRRGSSGRTLAPPPCKKAIAYQGDGYIAQAIGAATTSAMLNALDVGGSNDGMDKLFKSFDMVSSNSGGTWYAVSAIYSGSYVDMLNSMGRDSENAEGIYAKLFVDKLLQTDSEEDAAQMAYIDNMAGGLSYIVAALQKTADLGVNVTMGSRPNSWAEGKEWHACTSIVSPQADTSSSSGMSAYYFRGEQGTGEAVASFQNKEAGFLQYIPAHFSVKLGSGMDSSLHPFCASEQCFNWSYVVEGKTSEGNLKPVGTKLGVNMVGGLEVGAGALPVSYVTMSSAASNGYLVYNKEFSSVLGSCGSLATWVSGKAADGTAYDVAAKVCKEVLQSVTEESLVELAGEQVFPLVDGSFTDNTGVAWAVGSGATEVLAVLNWAWGWDPAILFTFLLRLFQPPTQPQPQPSGHPVSFPIFNTSQEEVKATLASFPTLDLSGSSGGFLKQISYGTIEATTVANKWFGVEAGRRVTLRVLFAGTQKISMGYGAFSWFQNYDYATLVGEIMSAFRAPGNAEATREILNTFYLSSCES